MREVEIRFYEEVSNEEEKMKVVKWYKRESERVNKDELLVDVETMKVIFQVLSPSDGVLCRIYLKEGEEVSIKEPLGKICINN